MPRSERQAQEICALCDRGALSRAIDLAYQHFADFGRNDQVLDVIADAIERTPVAPAVRRRFVDLRSSHR
jgi:hypothetical protein